MIGMTESFEHKADDSAPNPEKTSIPSLEPNGDFEMNTTPPDSNKVTMAAMGVILIVAILGAVIAITPKVKNIANQKERIASLESELARTKEEEAARVAQAKADAVAAQPNGETVNPADAELQGKLQSLEARFDQMTQQAHSTSLTSMLAKVQMLQQSPEGGKIISSVVGALSSATNGEDIGQRFENLRLASPDVAGLTEGVAPEDMKAAAMLIAMAQIRSALMRNNTSFDNDLALLKKTLPEGDQNLAAAIDRLAPQAKTGVLTPSGLSQEFRGMTGDIVSASLSGQDVSVGEKAKARLADIFMVEKNGERVSGTQSQIAIAAAQKQLDQGNVQGAVEILKTLNGPAAERTQPFLEKAQATLTAGNLQSILSQNLVQNVKAGVNGMVNGMPAGVVNPYGLPAMTQKIKSLMPGQAVPAAPPQ